MTDSTAGSNPTADSKFDVQSLPNFRSYPIVLAILGVLVGILGLILPYATVSFSIFDANLTPFEGSSDSPWLLSIPIGWIAVLLVVGGAGCAFAQLSESHTHKSGTVLGIITTACGVVGGMFVILELFWVSDKADEAGADALFNSSIDVSPGLGYFVLLLTMILITLSGVASLVHFDGKRHGR